MGNLCSLQLAKHRDAGYRGLPWAQSVAQGTKLKATWRHFLQSRGWLNHLNFWNPILKSIYYISRFFASLPPWTRDLQWSLFPSISQIVGLGQTIWADEFWGIWSIFGRNFSTYFGTASPLSMFFINQSLFLKKTRPLYPNPEYLLAIRI